MDYKLLPDEILIKLLKADDEAALNQIYLRYWKCLYLSALRKVRLKEIAEDLVQNIFISLWDRRQISDIIHLDSYLQTAIKYQVINHLKSKILGRKYLQLSALDETGEDASAESSLVIHDLTIAIDEAVQVLPQKTQLVFRLSRFENRSVKEISQCMKISEKAVEYHITQSLKSLRLHLKDFMILGLAFGLVFS
jgi:RNA polymerase sigma-70 factor (family 1)